MSLILSADFSHESREALLLQLYSSLIHACAVYVILGSLQQPSFYEHFKQSFTIYSQNLINQTRDECYQDTKRNLFADILQSELSDIF